MTLPVSATVSGWLPEPGLAKRRPSGGTAACALGDVGACWHAAARNANGASVRILSFTVTSKDVAITSLNSYCEQTEQDAAAPYD